MFNIILLSIGVIIGIWGVLLLGGIPDHGPMNWTNYQWSMIRFLWGPTVIQIILSLLLIILCIVKKYFVFPIIFAMSFYTLNIGLTNIGEVFKYGLIYPVYNISGLIYFIQFILALLGTILWIRKLKRKT